MILPVSGVARRPEAFPGPPEPEILIAIARVP